MRMKIMMMVKTMVKMTIIMINGTNDDELTDNDGDGSKGVRDNVWIVSCPFKVKTKVGALLVMMLNEW